MILVESAANLKMSDSLLARKYFDGIYIPAGLLVFGTFLTKSEWAGYAALLALALGAWKFFSMRMSFIGVLERIGGCKAMQMEQQQELTTTVFEHRTQEGPEARPIPGV